MIGSSWGATAAEQQAAYPCEDLLERVDLSVYRAVHVAAPVPVVYRWLCQLKVAPYSYDLLDNLGRRSPRQLTPGVEQLALGQRVMTVFRIADFRTDDHLTVIWRATRLHTQWAVSYVVRPHAEGTRLMVRVDSQFPGGAAGAVLRAAYPLGDLVMMRKQLLTLKRLAEHSPR